MPVYLEYVSSPAAGELRLDLARAQVHNTIFPKVFGLSRGIPGRKMAGFSMRVGREENMHEQAFTYTDEPPALSESLEWTPDASLCISFLRDRGPGRGLNIMRREQRWYSAYAVRAQV